MTYIRSGISISRFTVPGAHAHWVGSTATPESWH